MEARNDTQLHPALFHEPTLPPHPLLDPPRAAGSSRYPNPSSGVEEMLPPRAAGEQDHFGINLEGEKAGEPGFFSP